MAQSIRRSRVKQVPLSAIKDRLGRVLDDAAKQDIVITRRGRPVGVLIGFASDDDWFEYGLESDDRFQKRIESARKSVRAGLGVRLEDVDIKN